LRQLSVAQVRARIGVFEIVSRRNNGPIEEILVGFADLPFWMSAVGAAFVYLFLTFIPPVFSRTSVVGLMFADFFVMLGPWAAAAILLAGLVGVGRRHWRRLLFSRATSLSSTRQTAWPDFEILVGEVYRRQGYLVTERGGRQADGGIDLELARGRERVIVQCKHWLNRQVPVQRVRELLGVVTAEGADRGVLVATNGFTRDAIAFAAGKPLELIDGEALMTLSQRQAVPAAAKRPEVESSVTPTCDACGQSMVLRTARRGKKAGSQFWGCSSYPACRGTRAA
jgi:restriction system protein